MKPNDKEKETTELREAPAQQPRRRQGRRPAAAQDNKQPAQAPKNGVASGKKGKSAAQNREPVSQKESALQKTEGTAERRQPRDGKRPAQRRSGGRGQGKKNSPVTPVKITFLGGLNEIGKNITMVEYDKDALLIDCGMAFPDSDMLGVDIVLPDFTYVEKNKDRIRGIVLTHAHEDHIGGLPYLLKQVNLPIYGTRLTLALVDSKLKEHGLSGKVQLREVAPGDVVRFGQMSVEFIGVNHSIPDAVGLGIKTPLGYIVHTGDFKIDCTPITGKMIDLARFGELGNEGVLALLADSTNAERPGYTPSERVVGESFSNLFQKAEKKRIIIATFSSNLNRIQQILNASAHDKRKVAVSGRSMINFVNIATELGYLNVPDGLLIDIDQIHQYPKNKLTIITTGSQGEPMSALTRMAFSDHRQVVVGPDDYIIISATPIPGNEKAVGRVVNELLLHGCDVVYEKMYDVHTSGHACQEELKIIHGLVKPRYFIPVHGEQKHLQRHASLAKAMGMDGKHILIADIGNVVSLTPDKMEISETVQAGKVLVDGLGIGDVGSIVLRDRKHLAEDGLIVVVASIDALIGELVSGPDIVSRGFVYVREAEPLIEEMREAARRVLEECCHTHSHDWAMMKTRVRDEVSRLVFQRTKRSPMILPIIMDV